MKQVLISIGSIFAAVVFTTQMSHAQTNRVMKTQGPMYITSAAFFQSVVRLPDDVNAGEENLDYNGKKVNFSSIAISQFFGYQFNEYLALGAGISVDYWTTKSGFIPLYVDFRVNMTDKKIAPHWYINAGYAPRFYVTGVPDKIATGTGAKMYGIHGYTSGWLGETGFGIKASISNSASLLVSISGKAQASALAYYSGVEPPLLLKPLIVNTNSHSVYIFVGLKAGIAF